MEQVGVVIRELRKLRRATRRVLLMRAGAGLAAVATAGVLVLAFLDYGLRMPGAARAVLLLGLLAGLVVIARRHLLPAIRYAPSLVDIALRVETQRPDLVGRLASGVEFAQAGTADENPLAAMSLDALRPRVAGGFGRRLQPAPAWRAGGAAAAAIGVVLICVMVVPSLAATGAARVLTPWSGAAWPARTAVSSMMADVLAAPGVHPRGEVLPLRAKNETPGGSDERVRAVIRERRGGSFGAWRTLSLAHQGDGVHERLIEGDAEAIEIRFETADAATITERIQLVEPPAVLRASLDVTPPAYADGLVEPIIADLGPGIDERARAPRPAITGSTARLEFEFNRPIQPGEDAAEAGGAPTPEWIAATFGVDAATTEVAGSEDGRIWTLGWTVAEPLSLPLEPRDEFGLGPREPIRYAIDAVDDAMPRPTVIEPSRDERALPGARIDLGLEATDDIGLKRVEFRLSVRPQGSAAVPAELTDEVRMTLEADLEPERRHEMRTSFELGALDLSPGSTLLVEALAWDVAPEGSDRGPAVSELRQIRIVGEADFGTLVRQDLARVRQEAIRLEERQRELQGGLEGGDARAALDAARAQAEVAERIASQRDTLEDIRQRVDANRVDDEQLRTLLQQSGDLLDFAGRAANTATASLEAVARERAEAEGLNDEEFEAPTSRLELPESVRAEGENEEGASSDGENQPEGGEQSGDANQAAGGEQSDGGNQAAGGEQSDGGNQAAGGEQSGDGNQAAGGEQSGDENQAAGGEQSGDENQTPGSENQPQGGQPSGGQSQPQDGEPTETERAAEEAQQEVRDELTDLIRLLDRDEDTWLVRQQLDRIAEQQEALEERTNAVAEDLLGRDASELTEGERGVLEDLAEEQLGLAEAFDRLIEEMRRRAEAMEEADPQAAAGLEAAADEGESREAGSTMRDAAEAVEENRLEQASRDQAGASEALDRMQEALDEAAGVRTEELLRQLSSLRESIDRLIEIQERELVALARADGDAAFAERGRAMIRLERNTGSTAQQARLAGPEVRRIARALDRARDAQGEAIGALRATPVDAVRARDAEERSLARLREAAELATEAEEEAEQDRVDEKRAELMTAYRELFERQITVRAGTLELQEQDRLGRRGRQTARRLGNDQEGIRVALEALAAETPEIKASAIFEYVHQQLDSWSVSVRDRLYDADVGPLVTSRQLRIAEAIRKQIESIEELQAPPPEFADEGGDQEEGGGGQGGQGGQGGEPLLPPAAEIARLRGLQESVYEETRMVDETEGLDDTARVTLIDELSQMQQDVLTIGQTLLEELLGGQPGGDQAPGEDAGTPIDPGAPTPPAPVDPPGNSE